jgi:hypothetical protein
MRETEAQRKRKEKTERNEFKRIFSLSFFLCYCQV